MPKPHARFTQADVARKRPVMHRIKQQQHEAIRPFVPPDVLERSEKESTFVYFFKCGLHIKIGLSKNPRKRAQMFQDHSADNVQILYYQKGGRELEKYYHNLLSQFRVRGEWFKYHPVERFLSGLPKEQWIDRIIL